MTTGLKKGNKTWWWTAKRLVEQGGKCDISFMQDGQGWRKELSWTHLVDKMAKDGGKNCPGHT